MCSELLWGPQSRVPGRASVCPREDKQGLGWGAGYRVVGVVALGLGKVQPNHPWTEVREQEHWVHGQRGSEPGAHVGKHGCVYWSCVQEFTSVYNVPYRAGFVQSQPAVCGTAMLWSPWAPDKHTRPGTAGPGRRVPTHATRLSLGTVGTRHHFHIVEAFVSKKFKYPSICM